MCVGWGVQLTWEGSKSLLPDSLCSHPEEFQALTEEHGLSGICNLLPRPLTLPFTFPFNNKPRIFAEKRGACFHDEIMEEENPSLTDLVIQQLIATDS